MSLARSTTWDILGARSAAVDGDCWQVGGPNMCDVSDVCSLEAIVYFPGNDGARKSNGNSWEDLEAGEGRLSGWQCHGYLYKVTIYTGLIWVYWQHTYCYAASIPMYTNPAHQCR